MKSIDEKSFHLLVENYLHPFQLGQTVNEVLQEFADIDVTDEDLVRILTKNPVYHHLLDEFVFLKNAGARNSQKKGEEVRELMPSRRLLSLLGLVGSRNLILALRLSREASGAFPKSPDPRGGFKAENYLPHALKVEEICQKNQLLHSDTSYAAGFLYDWAFTLGRKKKVPSKSIAYADKVFKDSLGIAILAYGLGQKVSGFGFMKYTFAAGLSTGLGKIILAFQYKERERSWVDYQAGIDRKPPVSQVAALIDQRKKFHVSDGELSSLCLSFSTILQPAEQSLFYYQEPYFLKKSKANSYLLAVILHTASRMAQGAWTVPKDIDDPILKKWKNRWFSALKLRDQDLIEIMRWAVSVQEKMF